MDSRRWHSPAAAAAAAEAAEEAAGSAGAGGPSRRPLRRGLHRAAPYGLTPRRWLPKLPVASRIFPTLSHTASDNNQEDQHKSFTVMTDDPSAQPTSNAQANGFSTSINNKSNLLLKGDYRNRNDGNGLAEIERIIKQKHFSRDETEHLIKIMRSRTPDLSDENQNDPRSMAKGFEATTLSKDVELLSTPAKPLTSAFAPSNACDVGSSPIEIAKAYMEAQTLASVHESRRRKFRALSHGVEIDNSASKNFPIAAKDTPGCWPGSVVQDYPNYLIPQTNKGRTLPQTFSRTPYSGSVFPRSIKRTGYWDNYKNMLPGHAQPSTPFPVHSKAIPEDEAASVGAVHGVQESTSSKGAHTDNIGATPFFPREGSAVKNLSFNLQGAHSKGVIESGLKFERASAVDNVSKRTAASVHPKSSETANKILQQLERTIPSPMAKPLELRQLAAKRAASSAVTNSRYERTEFITSNGHRQSVNDESHSSCQELSDAKKAQSPLGSSNAKEFILRNQNIGTSEVPQVPSSEVPPMPSSQHPLSMKSDLTSMSAAEVLDKSASDSFNFTFPVTMTSSSLAEPPPTPNLTSPLARSLPADVEDTPKFTFGSSNCTNNLVFAFDSESSSVSADETIPTFKFGSGEKRELSFSVAGKDAVCF